VGQAVALTYGRRGNKSVPPEVIMRMMLLLQFAFTFDIDILQAASAT